jgi:chaperonin GroES
VLGVGPGKLLDSGKRGQMSVRKGDSVYYGKFAGTEIELATEELVVMREEDALVVVEPHN